MTLRDWLQLQLRTIDSVQSVTAGAGSDLLLHSWQGNRVQIYLIDQPVKTRTLRRILHDSSAIGTNSLFLLDHRLMPPDGERITLKEWMLAFHALFSERIYTYRMGDHEPEIIEIHFEPINGTSDHKAWYGPTVSFRKLRYFRATVKYKPLKGDWLIADFDSYTFWKNQDFQRFRAEQQSAARQRSRGQTTWQTWSGYQTWGSSTNGGNGSAPPPRSPLQTHLDECYKLLGLERSATLEEVKAAFRQQAKLYHPDTSDLPAPEASAAFQKINAAYDYIKAANGWS